MASFPNNIAISTSCLGQNLAHKLDDKIRAAAQQGFQGLEIVYADLNSYSRAHSLPILTSAKQIRQLADDLGVVLISLAPFENFEGAKTPLKERLAVAAHWLDLARVLGASYLQIPSQYDADSIGDEAVIVSEMQQLADLGSWWTGTISDYVWIHSMRSQSSGRIRSWKQVFVWTVPRNWLPRCVAFSKSHPWYIEGEPAEFTWSKHARPFPLERECGGYAPVTDVVRAWIVDSGFKGWVSMEIFDRRMRNEAYATDTAARRAWMSWEKVQAEFGRQKAKA